MQTFEAKKPGEQRTYTCGFNKTLPEGVTITGGMVTAAVYDKSDPAFPDAAPSAILEGGAALNIDEVTILGCTIAIGQALSQVVAGGVAGCTYVLTFKAVLSDNISIWEEDVLLPVRKYAPVI